MNSKAKIFSMELNKSSAYPDEMNWEEILTNFQTFKS